MNLSLERCRNTILEVSGSLCCQTILIYVDIFWSALLLYKQHTNSLVSSNFPFTFMPSTWQKFRLKQPKCTTAVALMLYLPCGLISKGASVSTRNDTYEMMSQGLRITQCLCSMTVSWHCFDLFGLWPFCRSASSRTSKSRLVERTRQINRLTATNIFYRLVTGLCVPTCRLPLFKPSNFVEIAVYCTHTHRLRQSWNLHISDISSL